MTKRILASITSVALLTGALSIASLHVRAQTPEAPSNTAATAGVLSLGEIESRLTSQGIEIREIELRDLVVEVEGRDAQGREVELIVDRRTGEILSQKKDR